MDFTFVVGITELNKDILLIDSWENIYQFLVVGNGNGRHILFKHDGDGLGHYGED